MFTMKLSALLLFFYFIYGFTNGNEVYNGGITSDHLSVDISDDPHCAHHMHKFYRQMECSPDNTPRAKCPTSYKCPTLQNRSTDLCYYGSKSYPVGFNLTRALVDFHTPCIESCQCVRMYEGARFYCSKLAAKSCPSPPGCRHFHFLEDFPCCQRGVTSCPQGKSGNIQCEFEGRTYSEGERFFPGNDMTCTQCICAAGFNGSLSAPYCHKFSCLLELWGDTPVMLTRGCIPIYLSEKGCCPLGYRCPKPSDRVIKPGKKVSHVYKTDKKCQFGNLTMEVGDLLSPWASSGKFANKVVCSCQVPPIASCVRQEFTVPDDFRREFAREGLDTAA